VLDQLAHSNLRGMNGTDNTVKCRPTQFSYFEISGRNVRNVLLHDIYRNSRCHKSTHTVGAGDNVGRRMKSTHLIQAPTLRINVNLRPPPHTYLWHLIEVTGQSYQCLIKLAGRQISNYFCWAVAYKTKLVRMEIKIAICFKINWQLKHKEKLLR